MKINSIDKNVKEILNSYYYKIPRFQRPYSWDMENIADFWTDTIQDSEADYFIGSMVVFKVDDDNYGVVDGQQRLTAITMILCALRDAFKKEGVLNLANGIHKLIERPNIDDKLQYVLTTESSFPYFQEYIQKFGEPSLEVKSGTEEKDIERTYTQIRAFIEDAVNSIKSDTTKNEELKTEFIKKQLISIRDKILSLKLIFIYLDNDDDAYLIFETLNTRGKDLRLSDLVKAHLTKLLKPKNVNVDPAKLTWEKIWTTIDGSASDIDIDSFLHHYWLSKYDYLPVKKMFKKLKRTVKKPNASNFLSELEKDSLTYREIHETAFRKWAREERAIKKALDALSLFRVKQQVPMVLSTMRDYKAGLLKRKDVGKILASIEKFHFMFTAVTSQRSSGGISQMYASSARKLVSAQDRNDKLIVLNDLYIKLKDRIPAYQEFEVNFEEIYFTNKLTKQKKLVRYILSGIDEHLNTGQTIDYENTTVEHLMPQSSVGKNGITEFDVGQLGNLMLIPTNLNVKLGKKSFRDKKEMLMNKKVFLDPSIKDAKSWRLSEIKKRTKLIAELAYKKVWGLGHSNIF